MPVTPNVKSEEDMPHLRSHSVSTLQTNESPSHQPKCEKSPYGLSGGGTSSNPMDMQLKYENDRLKLALAQR